MLLHIRTASSTGEHRSFRECENQQISDEQTMAELWWHRTRREHTIESNKMSKMYVISRMYEEIIQFWGIMLLNKFQWCFLILGGFVCRWEGSLSILYNDVLQGTVWLLILTREAKWVTGILSLSETDHSAQWWGPRDCPYPQHGQHTSLTISVFHE